MKRVAASILLLVAALFISNLFAAELNDFTEHTTPINNYTSTQNYVVPTNPFSNVPLASAGCPCDLPPSNPTVTLILLAAIAASLTMAMFIYGSHFIAALVAG